MDRVKVLHLITWLDVGGAQDNTLLTVAGLDRERYAVDLASQPHGGWLERGRGDADRYFAIPSMRRAVRPLSDLRAVREIETLIRRERYDVVHTHSSKAGVLGRLAARRAGAAVVVHTVHGFPFHEHMGSLRYRAYVAAERRAARWCNHLVFVAELNRQEALAHGIGDPADMSVIYSGIEIDRFHVDRSAKDPKKLAELGLAPDGPIVGTVGRHDRQKNPLDFVRAAKLVLQEIPTAQFIMVGDGALRGEVEALVGDEPRIKVLGTRSDIPELLALMDVFALSSLWEGLGRAMTEAMASGVPVVAPGVNGIPEIVSDGENGVLVGVQDPQALAGGLLRLLRDADLAQRLGTRAQERVRGEFEAFVMVDRIARLYEDLLRR